MKNYRWIIFGLLSLLLLAACNGSGKSGGKECLVGPWKLESADTFVNALLPAGAFDPGQLTFDHSSGQVIYSFGEDGGLTVTTLGFNALSDFPFEGHKAVLDIQINGIANATFLADDALVTMEKLKPSAIQYRALADDTDLIDTQKPEEFLPLFTSQASSARYHCSDDTLSLRLVNVANKGEEIVFRRVESK